MKKIILSLAMLCSFWVQAQNQQCSTDAYQEHLMAQPEYQQKHEAINRQLAQYIQQNPGVQRGGNPLIVPVVFHVIH